jgi:hypothetical protein
MSTSLAILGGLGGLVVFVGAVFTVIRGIFRQVGATEANTKALTELSGQIKGTDHRLGDHETRISRLEGRQ